MVTVADFIPAELASRHRQLGCTRHFPWRPRSFDPALRLQALIGQDRPLRHARRPASRIDV
ncbi:hypothetical protein A5690_06680 [Mycobacterium intracellulare]|nr:hypothetical protein A5690_06680 [Mycobacterium intracellulare]